MSMSACKTVRVPKQLLREFQLYVVSPDGRTEAEIIRSLMAEAVKRAKELMVKPKSDSPPIVK